MTQQTKREQVIEKIAENLYTVAANARNEIADTVDPNWERLNIDSKQIWLKRAEVILMKLESLGLLKEPTECCENCQELIAGYPPPKGSRFNREFRCRVFPFLFWYADNTNGIKEICCAKFISKAQVPEVKE